VIKRARPRSAPGIHENELPRAAAEVVAIPELGVRGEPMRGDARLIDPLSGSPTRPGPRLTGVVGLRQRACRRQGGNNDRGDEGAFHFFGLHDR